MKPMVTYKWCFFFLSISNDAFFLSISIIRKKIIDFELDSIICQDFVS